MGSTLTVDNIVGATAAANVKLPAGSVLQTVTKDFTDGTTITSSGTTYTDITNATITITPKYNNSKILIIPNLLYYLQDNSSTYIYAGFRCLRGSSTNIGPTNSTNSDGAYDMGIGVSPTGGAVISTLQYDNRYTAHHIDSPATTSSTTYKFQLTHYTAGRSAVFNSAGGSSSILAMEISV